MSTPKGSQYFSILLLPIYPQFRSYDRSFNFQLNASSDLFTVFRLFMSLYAPSQNYGKRKLKLEGYNALMNLRLEVGTVTSD